MVYGLDEFKEEYRGCCGVDAEEMEGGSVGSGRNGGGCRMVVLVARSVVSFALFDGVARPGGRGDGNVGGGG